MGEKAEQLRNKVQQEIVNIIKEKVEHGEMTEDRAKQIAQMVLEKLPEGMSYDTLMKVIPTLDDHFEELSQAVMPIMVEYEKRMKDIVGQKVTQLLEQGRLDEALNMTKKAIEFEKGLS
ncbi:hypothetical protein KC909_01380 [Candidatus Dojkabacteria bacterium]|uniref:Uncharacterized protein n=1 Tax=Candidatus Dojkabacteria bacterium TaxID=2099670 RepID=A0A955RIR3_9BACT|nr:hypothetical protein [Candidatus Dojkabacteria bacterium]